MKILKENLLDVDKNVEAICIPVNASVDAHGFYASNEQLSSNLRRKFPYFPRLLGACLSGKIHSYTGKSIDKKNALVRNLFTAPIKNQRVKIITVQTREALFSKSTVPMIERATKELVKLVDVLEIKCVWLPVFGTGQGKLDRILVTGTLKKILDDRFCLILTNNLIEKKVPVEQADKPEQVHNELYDEDDGTEDVLITRGYNDGTGRSYRNGRIRGTNPTAALNQPAWHWGDEIAREVARATSDGLTIEAARTVTASWDLEPVISVPETEDEEEE